MGLWPAQVRPAGRESLHGKELHRCSQRAAGMFLLLSEDLGTVPKS